MSDPIYDNDGVLVPAFWRPNIAAWEKQALDVRQRMSDKEIAFQATQKPKKPQRAHREYVPRFSTKYAKDWVRAKWRVRLVDEERDDAFARRHHDCQLALDAIFEDKDTLALIGVQGAGVGQRKIHRDRFRMVFPLSVPVIGSAWVYVYGPLCEHILGALGAIQDADARTLAGRGYGSVPIA